jgi:hypothetical protein
MLAAGAKVDGRPTREWGISQEYWIWLVVSNIIYFIFPNSWDDDPIWLSYFAEGLKPPTSEYMGMLSCIMEVEAPQNDL